MIERTGETSFRIGEQTGYTPVPVDNSGRVGRDVAAAPRNDKVGQTRRDDTTTTPSALRFCGTDGITRQVAATLNRISEQQGTERLAA